MAVTSWTSEGMDWTALSGRPRWAFLEAIRLAVVERCQATGTTIPAVLADPLAIGTYAWADAVRATVSTLIPKFANHIDHDGDWEGGTTAPPVWSGSGILSAIGAGERMVANPQFGADPAWCRQQYDMLNMLRWVRTVYQSGSPGCRVASKTGPQIEGFAAAKAAFDALPWGDWGVGGLGEVSTITQYCIQDAYGQYKCGRKRCELTTSIPPGMLADLIVYHMPTMSGGIFEDPDYGATSGHYVAAWSQAALSGSVVIVYPSSGTYDGSSGFPVPTTRGYQVFAHYLVSKFDVPGGFAFIA